MILVLLAACFTNGLSAQVSEIKSASSNNSSKSASNNLGDIDYDSDYTEHGDGIGGFMFEFLFGGISWWQSFKLRSDRARYPSMVSIDAMIQMAAKPASYYLVWPRICGNVGLFGTDFRMNYLIEEGIDGYRHIRTNDWKMLQLNLVTSKFFTFRLGTGYMQEAFNAHKAFSESTAMVLVHAPDQTKVLGFEFRTSKDWSTDANPRREFSIQYQNQLFVTGKMHGYASLGWVYQRYYNSINVWGIQGGLVFRFF